MNLTLQRTLFIFVTIIALLLSGVYIAQGRVSGQELKKATECGSGLDFNVQGNCSVQDQVTKCKNNTPGNAQQKNEACNPQSSIEKLIKTVLNVFSAIVGAVAVIMVIIGGFRYVTSAGDANAASSARKTILFAIVGLIIVAFAQIIVKFVLERI